MAEWTNTDIPWAAVILAFLIVAFLVIVAFIVYKARGCSPTKKIHIAFFLSLPGVVFGLCAWIAFVLAIVAMRKLEPSEKTWTTIGLLVGALVLGGIVSYFP